MDKTEKKESLLTESEKDMLADLMDRANLKPLMKNKYNDVFIFSFHGRKDIKHPIIPITANSVEEAIKEIKDIIKDNHNIIKEIDQIEIAKVFAIKPIGGIDIVTDKSDLKHLRLILKENEMMVDILKKVTGKNVDEMTDTELFAFLEAGTQHGITKLMDIPSFSKEYGLKSDGNETRH